MNTLQKLGFGLAAIASITTSTQVLSASLMSLPYGDGLHDKHVYQRSYSAKIPVVGTTIARSGYRMYSDAHSHNPNHFTINTSMKAHASVFNSGQKGVEFLANGWEKGRAGRAVHGIVRINGKSVFNQYKKGYGTTSVSVKDYKRITKEIGRGRQSFGVGPLSVSVSAGIDGVIRPGLEVAANNPNPYDTRNGWVRVIHRNNVSLDSDASAGVDFWLAGAGVTGGIKFINFGTGSNPKDTKITLKRSSIGNTYFNRANLNLCTLGGTLDVWVKVFGKKFSKRLLNQRGFCSNRQLHFINNKPIKYQPVNSF